MNITKNARLLRKAEKGSLPVILLAGTPKEYISLLYASEDFRYCVMDEASEFINMSFKYDIKADVRFFTSMLFPFNRWTGAINNITVPLCQEDLRLFPEAEGKTMDAAKGTIFKKVCRELLMLPMQKAINAAMQARFDRSD